MVYDPQRVGQNCEFCGSPALVGYEEIKAPIRPKACCRSRSIRHRVRDDIRRWWRSKWLAPGRLAKAALVDTVHSLYIPYWTFDAHAHCPWDAEAGHYYYVNVEGRDSKGRPRRPPGTPRRDGKRPPASSITSSTMSRCRARRGAARSAAAGRAVSDRRSVVPTTRPFSPATSSSTTRWCCVEAAEHSRAQMRATARAALRARRCPATRIATCGSIPTFSGQTFKHLLVPIWLLIYIYGRKAYQVVVNGYTGKIAGNIPTACGRCCF